MNVELKNFIIKKQSLQKTQHLATFPIYSQLPEHKLYRCLIDLDLITLYLQTLRISVW